MVEIEKLEVLRAMTYVGLFGYLGMSDLNNASNLKTALQMENYDVITDKSKTRRQMADALGKKLSSVTTYRSMLTKYDFADKFEFTVENSVRKRLEKFLDRKPSYFNEIREGVKGFYPDALQKDKKIASVGHGKKLLYFLKGQKRLAKKELEKREMKNEKAFLDAIAKPVTIANIKNAKISLDRVNDLEDEGKLFRVKRTSWSSPLEDGPKLVLLIEDDEIYRPGQELCIADRVIEKIQALGVLRREEKSSLSAVVRNFPKPISNIVRQSYAHHYKPK